MSGGAGVENGDNGATPPCFCLVLAEPEAMELAVWVRDIVAERSRLPLIQVVLRDVGAASEDGSRFCSAVLLALEDVMRDTALPAGDTGGAVSAKTAKVRCLVIAVFWDGQSETVKADFTQLRQLAETKKSTDANAASGKSEGNGAGGTRPNVLQTSEVRFIVQVLNAKKGEHTLKENSEALLSTIRKKLMPTNAVRYVDPQNSEGLVSSMDKLAMVSSATLPASCGAKGTIIGKEELSEAAIAARITEGQGECFVLVSSCSMEEFQTRVEQLQASAKALGAGCTSLVEEPRWVQGPCEANTSGDTISNVSGGGGNGVECGAGNRKAKFVAQEFLLRQSESETHIELRLAMCGNVDSGKSTLTSVLTHGCCDDGRGSARALVFKHKHEAATGRTSSVSENHLGLSSTGEVVNYTAAAQKRLGGPGNATSAGQLTEVVTRSAKVLTLYDLAGHERYLKTTVLGMTRNMPDYACVVISANNGIQRMTKEHIALCLALKVPFFVVVTRIDSTPENVRQETLTNIHKLLKIPTVRKLPYPVRRVDDIVLTAKNLRADRIVPIFEVSNVTGDGIQVLVRFLNLLPVRKDWRKARTLPREMVIDNTFFVKGVGTVVGGIVTQGVFYANDTVLLGPDSFGAYRTVHIKSIHVKGKEQQEVVAGCDATFCLKKEKRSAIRKGSILTDPRLPVEAYWQFEADVTILYHSTTILVNYEPVIHSTTVRQSARIVYVAQEVLRTGDRSLVRFHFLYRPEFMKVGQQLIFREGRTKGVGTVTKVIVDQLDSVVWKKRRR
ncbi:putative GTP-binding elongation factor tu family protein [Trypanosoma rangeli]|uniref:Putative GTP-binding elongation factor tu family protein n=1 Tax=Trypanosoma rangeli TaxID=5698 RepID=A0A3R7MHD3_TRYRA|nr:putative GTP-binding elongation factor tu family protein [Trypanosoma rangeli]RNF05918.1 putative GTP-binding elongation factor tu family protein [Trypanosoma rangeli]|eukprot:RNF05918.1 putative GTP-binding elongation factor tu family protein [Trypanosoma rangeli]